IYRIDREGNEKPITRGDYDVMGIDRIDEAGGYIYFSASPGNATQRYLYRVKLSGGRAKRLTPENEAGTHNYTISPNGKIALHRYSSHTGNHTGHVVSLPNHHTLVDGAYSKLPADAPKPEFFSITTENGIQMDGWMIKPTNFDPTKKYPIVFYVYGEPAAQTVIDQ